MSKIIQAKQDFAFSPNGTTVESYVKGQIVDVSDECAACAVEEDWATEVTPDDLVKAQAAYDKLCKAAEKAEAAADKADADAAAGRASAVNARERATAACVGTDAEAAAAELED